MRKFSYQRQTFHYGTFNGRTRRIGIGTAKPRTLSKCFCLFAHFVAKPCALGRKSLFCLLGKDREKWQQYDANSLIQQGYKVQGMRIDQGLEDEFLPTQLRTEDFIETCRAANQPADVRFHKGYDHSYYFIASFIGEHIAYHAAFLK